MRYRLYVAVPFTARKVRHHLVDEDGKTVWNDTNMGKMLEYLAHNEIYDFEMCFENWLWQVSLTPIPS